MSVQPPRNRHPERVDIGGETLGPFQLLDEVAAGELATFHRARPIEATSGAATLVIKRLRREHLRSPEHRSALQREAELSATLRSAGFVRTLSFEKSPELYTVMDYVEGGNLALLLALARRHDVETARFALPLLVGAIRSLDDLHRGHDATGATSLTHQAPVARHILAGVDGNARLIDLTLAMGPSTPRAPLCDHRLQPAEMAPEQVLAPSMVDSRADIFIVGITLWESLTGQRLFDGKNPLESQRRMLSGAVVAPSEAFSGVHRGFDRICMRALARPRGERYPTAGDMASELEDEARRAGLFAEPAEVGAWVRSTLALARTAPRTGVPRESARSEVAQTMMGIGGPNPAILSIADSYRQSNANSPRNTRRLRSTAVTNAPEPPARRESVVPIGDDAGEDATSLITRGRTQPPPEPERLQIPDISQLGQSYPVEGDGRDSGYDLRAAPRSRTGVYLLCAMGVVAAGVFAFVMRQQKSAETAEPFVFGAAPVAEPAALAVPAPAPAQAAWPSEPAAPPTPEPVGQATMREPIEQAAPPEPVEHAVAEPAMAEPPAVPREPIFVPPVVLPATPALPSVPPTLPTSAKEGPHAARSSTHKPAVAPKEPAAQAPAPAAAAPARKGHPAQRWDVSSTLGGGKAAGWATPAKPAEAPGWTTPPPAAPAAKQPDLPAPAPNSDLPINPY
jgi:eukaryotic-like serine/threonine-protein kinase